MNQNLNEDRTMKEEAQRVLSELHNNEHRQMMRIFSIIHNGLLLLFLTILVCVFGNLWLLLLLALWDFEYTRQKNEQKKPFVSLKERWGK